MDNILKCSICNFDNTHFLGTLKFEENDHYEATRVIINDKYFINTEVRYGYRSQGNIHLLFLCEDGHFFIKSFDGHKGNVHCDNNELVFELTNWLNEQKNPEHVFYINYELLSGIERFFKHKRE